MESTSSLLPGNESILGRKFVTKLSFPWGVCLQADRGSPEKTSPCVWRFSVQAVLTGWRYVFKYLQLKIINILKQHILGWHVQNSSNIYIKFKCLLFTIGTFPMICSCFLSIKRLSSSSGGISLWTLIFISIISIYTR